MIPILYDIDEYQFTTNGIGRLSDAISCKVTEERNGAYELVMEYPETGIHAKELATDRIIWAKPSAFGLEQPFRIYKITKPLNKKIKVLAQHISYDLAYTTVMPCTGISASNALAQMAAKAINIGRFTTWSNVSTSAGFAVTEPASFRNIVGGKQGSILDVYGGELEWDVFNVKLHASRGRDRGLTLRYGKNITDIEQEQDIEYTVTGVTPYLVDSEKNTLTLPEKTIWKSGVTYSPRRDKALNMQSYVDERGIREANPDDTEAQIEAKLISAMRSAAQAYVDANITGVPDAAIEVSFVNLGDTEEYKGWKSLFTQAGLCDTVTVEYERLGVSTTAKIVKTEYDVLLERFNKLTIGKTKTNLVSNIFDLKKSITDSEERGKAANAALGGTLNVAIEDLGDEISITAQNLANAIANASDLITGAKGGYVVIDRDTNGYPYEILIMDTPNKSTARKVWRWNQNGLGYSSTGYNGTYSTAITANGQIVADFITTGSLSASLITAGILNASLIKAGILTDSAGLNWWNMSSGAFSFANGNMVYDLSEDYIRLKNNLSFKFNGIPLAGKVTTFFKRNPSAFAKIGGTLMLYFNSGETITTIEGQIVQYPYMTTVFIHAYVQSLSSDKSFLLIGFPSIAETEEYWQGGGADRRHIAMRWKSSTGYISDVWQLDRTPEVIAEAFLPGDYYKTPPSGYIGTVLVNTSTTASDYYCTFSYASNAETVEFK